MIKHIQTIFGDNGDCFRTAIACLLDTERVEDIPHFFDGNPPNGEGWKIFRKWLNENKDLGYFTVAFDCGLEEVLSWVKINNPGLLYLLTGSGGDFDHIVIAYEDKIIHDPNGITDDKSIVGPDSDGYYWVSFLVPNFHLPDKK